MTPRLLSVSGRIYHTGEADRHVWLAHRCGELVFDCVRWHLPLDASIQGLMQASLLGCRPGICMKMLSSRRRASSIGCGLVDEAALSSSATARSSRSCQPLRSGFRVPLACFTRSQTAMCAQATGNPTIWSWAPGGPALLDFIAPDLLNRLSATEQAECAVGLEHDLGRLLVGIVVDGRHRRAVGAGAADDREVTDGRSRSAAGAERLGIAGGRREDVAGLAAGADEDRVDLVAPLGKDRDRMLGAVE